jgi:hypothetical protein
MNYFPLSMSNVLLGTVDSSADAAAIGDRYRAAGGDTERLVVLRGQDGIDALEGTATGGSAMSRWVRRAYRVFDTIAAHIVDTAVDDLKHGATVLVVRQVDAANAEEEGWRLRRLGAIHLHHSGRWTSVEHGDVPAPRDSSIPTTA